MAHKVGDHFGMDVLNAKEVLRVKCTEVPEEKEHLKLMM